MKTGTIVSYNKEKGMGIIFVDSTVGERYFFYGNRVVGGPEPTVGAEVLFSVSSKSPKPGQLPYAANINIVQRLDTPKAATPASSTGGLSVLGGVVRPEGGAQ